MSTARWFAYVFQSVLWNLGSCKWKCHTQISRGLILTLCVLGFHLPFSGRGRASAAAPHWAEQAVSSPDTPLQYLGLPLLLHLTVENRNGNCLFPFLFLGSLTTWFGLMWLFCKLSVLQCFVSFSKCSNLSLLLNGIVFLPYLFIYCKDDFICMCVHRT